MKKIILGIILTITALNIYAAKSTGEPHNFIQPDGTTITVQLLGDEDFSWYQTTDGILLVRADDCFYIARTDSDGVLYSTGIQAHNADARGEKELRAISDQDKSLFFNDKALSDEAKCRHRVIEGYPSARYCPHTGTVRVPIILMNYPDTTFTYGDQDTWDNYFNSNTTTTHSTDPYLLKGYGSVAKFFSDASHGRLSFVFDIYGPYTTDYGHHHYGHNTASGETALVQEAVLKSDPDIDFSQYDANHDGNVDLVYIVYAGTGANTSHDNNDFWPKCWHGSLNISTGDNVSIHVIGGANELALSAAKNNGKAVLAGIGVTCHEISHGLGLPDLYWTSGTPRDAQGKEDWNNCGPEDWDIMDGGENLCTTVWPCQYTAWEREILGWLDVKELKEPETVTLYPLNKDGGNACRVTNPANSNEYYIIENYQNDEWNDYINSLYGSGLMITHVNTSSEYGLSMTPNNTYGKPNVTIIPADGSIIGSYSVSFKKNTNDEYTTGLKGDPYLGTLYSGTPVTSVAAYNNYTGKEMVTTYPITDITRNDDGSITFKFMGGQPTAIKSINADHPFNAPIYTVDGRMVGTDASSLPHGLYICGGKKFVK